MLHLGLHNVSCPDDADISLRIPSAEDFRGPVEVFVEATHGSDRCGRWKIQSRMAILNPHGLLICIRLGRLSKCLRKVFAI